MSDHSVGDTVERTVEGIERADFVRYAGASGDFNPIHFDEPHARSSGYESPFGQGMFTSGVASRAVREAFGLQGLREFETRFVSQVWPGDDLTTTVAVTAVEETDAGDRVEADVTVTDQDGETVVEGRAVAVV
ncbi:MaoC family dehydratase [Halomarina salina]|uniref:MaoC family dehydratase n=1 Tax=Halomarina salina TaxID=1872699 RepID=A0ABD5RT92_9EURY|nr:MaoC/PaaZ C-terminal domain-containing protein [Halomarina salina]